MDSVVFDGVEYLKASVIAKQFRYTQDYVGQLCRAKKVDARLVGRTWFVNPGSLQIHKKARYKSVKSLINKSVTEDKSDRNIAVSDSFMAKVNSPVRGVISKIDNKKTIKRKLRVAYELDEETLIPNLIRKETPPPTSIPVNPANAKKVPVKGGDKKQTTFCAEELPEVSLSGELQVSDFIPEPVIEKEVKVTKLKPLDVDNKTKNIDKTPNHIGPSRPTEMEKIKTINRPVRRSHRIVLEVKLKGVAVSAVKFNKSPGAMKTSLVKKRSALKISSSDRSITKKMKIASGPVVSKNLRPASEVNQSLFSLVVLPVATLLLALVCGFTVIALSSEIDVPDSGHQFSLVFHTGVLAELLDIL